MSHGRAVDSVFPSDKMPNSSSPTNGPVVPRAVRLSGSRLSALPECDLARNSATLHLSEQQPVKEVDMFALNFSINLRPNILSEFLKTYGE
jgi:hypothetical protein